MNYKICIVGLGYVGLPLAIEFAKKYLTVGFDISEKRIIDLNNNFDNTLEVNSNSLKKIIVNSKTNINDISSGLILSNDVSLIKDCNIYIITVPTPVDDSNQPILTPLIKATSMVGEILKTDDIVIYESTVYPGLTEEICVPILERISQLTFNKSFFVGYSPERINPGDKERTLTKIIKVTSGSTPKIAKKIDNLYKSIISAGTHMAPSIKIAEAAKVIENSQRDINIAFVNELAKIFNLLKIDTEEVLKAAGTKWNFLNFKPGLVGGHCIGVDPYYLTKKAIEVGYKPEIILSGRRLNDSMGEYVTDEVIKLMKSNFLKIENSNVLILGITFKENCPDVRNSKVIDLINKFKEYKCNATIFDPWANIEEVKKEYNLDIVNELPNKKYESIVLAVAHNEFLNINYEILKNENSIIYDVKGILGKQSDGKL